MKSFLEKTTSWSNAGLGLIKICATFFGISVGIVFRDNIAFLLPFFLIIFALTAIAGVLLWVQKSQC